MKWSLLLLGLVAVAGTAAACEGLSPGDDLNAICTLGFLVADPSGLYFTTAGHCIQVDEKASSADVGEWGVGVFHFLDPETGSQQDGSPGMDFALVKVNPDAYGSLNPKMCGYDGPTGLYNETPGEGGVQTWGHGIVFGDAGDFGFPTYKRPGFLLLNEGDAFYWFGANTPGDSGGAVLSDDNRAIGVVTHLTLGLGGTNGGTTMDRGFQLASEKGFTQLRLVLAGEDPVKVLADLRGGKPASETPVATTPGGAGTTNGTNATKPAAPSQAGASANGTTSENDSISPAATGADGDDDAAPVDKSVPFVPPAFLALALALALALRSRHRV